MDPVDTVCRVTRELNGDGECHQGTLRQVIERKGGTITSSCPDRSDNPVLATLAVHVNTRAVYTSD